MSGFHALGAGGPGVQHTTDGGAGGPIAQVELECGAVARFGVGGEARLGTGEEGRGEAD